MRLDRAGLLLGLAVLAGLLIAAWLVASTMIVLKSIG